MAYYVPGCIGNYNFTIIALFARIRFIEGRNTIDLMRNAKTHREKEEIALNDAPGTLITDEPGRLLVACRDGYLHIKKLQLEGKRMMNAEDFIRGIQDPSILLIQG